MKLRLGLLVGIMLAIVSCSQKEVINFGENNTQNLDKRYQVVKESFLYALLSVNAYETEENSPFVLPEYIREVRHADSRLSEPSPEYVNSNVYDNGSFQAKVFEIDFDGNKAEKESKLDVVIAYRGTQKILSGDILMGTLTNDQRRKAVLLYEEIKNKYSDKNANISLTGHSLGGALALEVVYTYNNDDIQTYVFNSSYKISRNLKNKTISKRGQLISIEEKNDAVVGPLKSFWRTPKGLNIYQFDYIKTLIMGNHSRYNIALGLLKEAKEKAVKEGILIYNLNRSMYQ